MEIGEVSPPEQDFPFLKNLPPPEEPRFWDSGPDTRIAWNEFGDPAGNPVLYYHGWPSSRLQARALHHLARERGLRVIAPDRPGMGRSTPVPGRSLEDWAPLVGKFADSLGIGRFAQLGVSGGGPYVLPCAATLGDRIAGSAVLCGAVPLGPGWERNGLHPAYRLMIRLNPLPPECFSPAFRIGGWLASHNPSRPPLSWLARTLPEEDRDILLHHADAVPIFAASFIEGVRQGGRGVMADADVYLKPWDIDLSAISHPIPYWHGGQDRNIPAALVERFTARIPGARLTIEKTMGHFSLALRRAERAMDHLAACFPPAP